MLSLPLEIFNNILNYLNINEIATLRATCKHLNISVNSPTICQPYLNRLKKLDKRISVLPPEKYQEDWCYHRFVEGFNQIAQDQQAEIQYFLTTAQFGHGVKKELVTDLLKRLEDLNAPATTLDSLEERHEILENLNAAIIENEMLPLKPLNLINCLTRFPVRVFNAANKDYWTALQILNCRNNPLLRSLPSELRDCKELIMLDCPSNQLESLPSELSKCLKLKHLYCNNNKLRAFPPELGQCPITMLDCSNNLLRSIPIEILNWLNYSNGLWAFFNNNQIIIIPEELKKFGDHWYNNTLKTQKPDLSAYLPELITALNSIKENKTTITPLITSSSTPEPIQYTGGEKRTLENDNDLNGNNDKDEDENSNKRKRSKK